MTKAKRGNGQGSVRQLPSGKWQWTITLGIDAQGKQIRLSGTEENKGAAEKAKAQAIADHSRGGLAAPNRVTVGEWLTQWLANHKTDVKSKTFQSYRYNADKYLVPVLGSKKLQALRPADIRAFVEQLKAKGLGRNSQRIALGVLNQALKEAVKLEVITRNPAEVVKLGANREGEGKAAQAWTADEARQFIEVAKPERFGELLVFMLSTGLRRGEACGLRWANVDLETGLCRIAESLVTIDGKPQVSTPKTASGKRDIYLPHEAIRLLKDWKARQNQEREAMGSEWHETGYVFTTIKGTPIHPDNLNRAFTRMCTSANIRRIRVHDLRHTYASLRLKNGVPLEVVSKDLGHATPAITLEIYRHVDHEEQAHYAMNLSELVKPLPAQRVIN